MGLYLSVRKSIAEINSGKDISCFSLTDLCNRIFTLAEFKELYTLIQESAEIQINLQCQRGTWNLSKEQYDYMLANGQIDYP